VVVYLGLAGNVSFVCGTDLNGAHIRIRIPARTPRAKHTNPHALNSRQNQFLLAA
jgi:hypothetical protein